MINQELEALLVVQADDTIIRGIEARRADVAPRLAHLEQVYKRAGADVARAEAALERERAEQRNIEQSLSEVRARHEHNTELLNQAQKVRDAEAAARQLEESGKSLANLESRALVSSRRVSDLRTAASAFREVLSALTGEQQEARETIARELEGIDRELAAARAKRTDAATKVGPGLLSKYERITTRRQSEALIELRQFNCSACDTAIPLQRRPAMSSGMYIEPCEGCGVLLYMRPAPGPA